MRGTGQPALDQRLRALGAIEQHGPHLPLSTDTVIATAVAEAAIDALVAEGNIDSAKVNLKTLHYMVYLGRP